MLSTNLERPLLALAVAAGLLAVTGPASAGVVTNNNDPDQVNGPSSFAIDIGSSEQSAARATNLNSDNNEIAGLGGIERCASPSSPTRSFNGSGYARRLSRCSTTWAPLS